MPTKGEFTFVRVSLASVEVQEKAIELISHSVVPLVPGKWVKIQVYVRFFGPKGLNSWISAATHFPFDPVDVADDLRYGIRLAKKPITEKMAAELNWAIEDAQVVAGEIDLTKRSDVFAGIINDQFKLVFSLFFCWPYY